MSRSLFLSLLPLGLLGGLAAPAAAQDGPILCSGQPARWLGDTAGASDISIAAAPLRQDLTAQNGSGAHVAFRVGADRQLLRIEAEARSSGDPSLRLETPEGDLLAENDDAAGTLSSRIEESVGPGDYCLRLVPVGTPPLTATVQVATLDMPALLTLPEEVALEDCTSDTPSQPLAQGPLEAALPLSVRLDGARHYLRFTLSERQALTLRAVGDGVDPTMTLYDGNGARLAQNDDADGLNARLDFVTGLAPGAYCLGVAPVSPGSGTITLSAEAVNRDAFLRGAWRRGEVAPALGGDHPMQEIDLARDAQTVVLQDGSAQWLSFAVARPTMLIVSAYGALVGVDSRLALFGPDGAVVAQNDDIEGGLDARVGPVLLEPGRYRLAVTDVTRLDQPGAPVRPVGLVFERFERVE